MFNRLHAARPTAYSRQGTLMIGICESRKGRHLFKMPGVETARVTFEDAKEYGAGAITFACPDCAAEGRHDKECAVFLHQPELYPFCAPA
jgi:hypothetical protein